MKLLLALFLAAAIPAALIRAESSAETEDGKWTLAGVFQHDTNRTAWLSLKSERGLNEYAFQAGWNRGGIRVESVSVFPPEVNLRANGKTLVLNLDAPKDWKDSRDNIAALIASEMSRAQWFEVYGRITGRTILRKMDLPDSRFSLAARGSRIDLVRQMDRVFLENGIGRVPYRDKFVLLLPKGEEPPALPEFKPNVGAGGEDLVSAGTLSISGMPMRQFLQIYETISGEAVGLPRNLPVPFALDFQQQTDLTRAETVHAMDVLLALNRLQVRTDAAGIRSLGKLPAK